MVYVEEFVALAFSWADERIDKLLLMQKPFGGKQDKWDKGRISCSWKCNFY